MSWLNLGTPELRAPILAMTVWAMGIGFLGVWAGVSRRHWFVRASVLMLVIAVLLPIRAYEPALLSMLVAPGIALAIAGLRRRIGHDFADVLAVDPHRRSSIRVGLRVVVVYFVGAMAPAGIVLVGSGFAIASIVGWYEAAVLGAVAGGLLFVLYRTSQESRMAAGVTPSTFAPPPEGRPRDESQWNFGVRDALMGFVIVGWLCAMIAFIRGHALAFEWPGFLATSLCLILLVVSSATIVLLRHYWILAAFFMYLVVFGSATLHTLVLGDWIGVDEILWMTDWTTIFKAFLIAFLLVGSLIPGLTYLLLVAASFDLAGSVGRGAGSARATRRVVLPIICLVLYVPLIIVYARMLSEPPLPTSPATSTNVIAEITQAVRELHEGNEAEATISEIRDLKGDVETSQKVADAYNDLLKLLEQPASVQIDFDQVAGKDYVAKLLPDIQAPRSITRTWQREAQESVSSGRIGEALKYDLAILRLGAVQQKGGLIVHSLVGISIEGIGIQQIAANRSRFSAANRRQMVDVLLSIERDREAWHSTVMRDAVMSDRAYTWRIALSREAPVVLALYEPEDRFVTQAILPSAQAFQGAVLRADAMRRLLIADTAIRLFRDDHERWPNTLDELCPRYFATAPIDPFSDQPLIYRLAVDGFLLYSVGRDGRDDGGRFGTFADFHTPGFDFDLDIDTRTATAAAVATPAAGAGP